MRRIFILFIPIFITSCATTNIFFKGSEEKEQIVDHNNLVFPKSSIVGVSGSEDIIEMKKVLRRNNIEEQKCRLNNIAGVYTHDFFDSNQVQQLKIVFKDILFDVNSSLPQEQSISIISQIIHELSLSNFSMIEIFGHTDASGDYEHNKTLSINRANSIKELFVAGGFQESTIITKGFADTNPIADNNTSLGKQKNRRVEIFLYLPI